MSVFNYNLFNLVDDGSFIQSATGGGAYSLPRWKLGDIVSLNIQLIRRTGPVISPTFTIIDPNGLSLAVGIGVEGGTPLALQTSWTVENQFFKGTLDLTATALATAVAASAALFLELKVADADSIQRVYHQPITLLNPVIGSTVTNPTPAATYPTLDEANAFYVRKSGLAGEGITLKSPDGTKQVLIYVEDDGTLHTDLIT